MKKWLERLEEFTEWGGIPKDVILLVLGGLSLMLSLINQRWTFLPLPFDIAWVAILLCGIPILLEAFLGLVTRLDIKADVLVAMALVASVCIHEDFAAGEVAFIMQLGELLEELTVAKARSGMEKLVRLTPQTARILRGEEEKILPVEQVKAGDILRVLPGESIPVDGEILVGETSIDQSVMTGESLPVDKRPGDELYSGTVNAYGAFTMKATRVGEDSSLQRMIRLVQSADAGKAKIVGLADRWATWIVITALSAAALTWLFTGGILRAVTILVVFCPCALVLATPTAMIAAMGNATGHGFLVRQGDALERLAGVDTVTFDKTGTLTHGTPAVTQVKSVSAYREEEIFAYAAAAEGLSEHPLGKAIVKSYAKPLLPVEDFHIFPGEGVTALVAGKRIDAGNPKLLAKIGLSEGTIPQAQEAQKEGGTVIYIAVEKELAGYILLSDTLREDAADMVKKITSLNITPVLLTGDNEKTAAFIAEKLSITQVTANCLPENKLEQIEKMQKSGKAVLMIGDGINDAPALKTAQVGIAMGGIGSDIAVEAADIALVNDEIRELPHLLALSRRMMTTIRCNLAFSMSLNFLSILLAITGALGPVVGALVHNAGSVLVILNSALLLKWRKKRWETQ